MLHSRWFRFLATAVAIVATGLTVLSSLAWALEAAPAPAALVRLNVDSPRGEISTGVSVIVATFDVVDLKNGDIERSGTIGDRLPKNRTPKVSLRSSPNSELSATVGNGGNWSGTLPGTFSHVEFLAPVTGTIDILIDTSDARAGDTITVGLRQTGGYETVWGRTLTIRNPSGPRPLGVIGKGFSTTEGLPVVTSGTVYGPYETDGVGTIFVPLVQAINLTGEDALVGLYVEVSGSTTPAFHVAGASVVGFCSFVEYQNKGKTSVGLKIKVSGSPMDSPQVCVVVLVVRVFAWKGGDVNIVVRPIYEGPAPPAPPSAPSMPFPFPRSPKGRLGDV